MTLLDSLPELQIDQRGLVLDVLERNVHLLDKLRVMHGNLLSVHGKDVKIKICVDLKATRIWLEVLKIVDIPDVDLFQPSEMTAFKYIKTRLPDLKFTDNLEATAEVLASDETLPTVIVEAALAMRQVAPSSVLTLSGNYGLELALEAAIVGEVDDLGKLEIEFNEYWYDANYYRCEKFLAHFVFSWREIP